MKTSSFIVNIENGKLGFKSKAHKAMFENFLKQWDGKTRIEFSKVTSQRSYWQNRALHKWYEQVAEELNNAGYTVQLVLKEKVDLEWDKDTVKELLWRPAQKALLGKKSTVDLRKTGEIDMVWEHLNRHLGEKFGIHIPFPSEHSEPSDYSLTPIVRQQVI